jgi:hypothetical protein
MRKTLLAIIVLLAVSLPLIADVTVGGEVLYGFTLGTSAGIEEKGEAKVSVAGAVDFATATVDVKVNQDADEFFVDKALIEIDLLGGFGLSDLPVTVTWMAGFFDSGPQNYSNVEPYETAKVYDDKPGKSWEFGTVIDILDMVGVKLIMDPEYVGVKKEQPAFFVGAYGGYQWIKAEFMYTNKADSGYVDDNDETVETEKGMLGGGLQFDSLDLIMGGDLGIKVGFGIELILADLVSPAGVSKDSIFEWGAAVNVNYLTWISLGIGLNGMKWGNYTDAMVAGMSIYAESFPLDFLGIKVGANLALYKDAPSTFDKFEAAVVLKPGAAEMSIGYVFIPEDAAANSGLGMKGDLIAWKENRGPKDKNKVVMGGGFFINTKVSF